LDKIKIGIVNYLNTKPLLYGIQHSPVSEQIILIEDYPANIARLLMDGSIDAGLVPVAVIPYLNEYHIITDYCIGANGRWHPLHYSARYR
jgi:chorismate dehydratase